VTGAKVAFQKYSVWQSHILVTAKIFFVCDCLIGSM
jgi:hypothetical protein